MGLKGIKARYIRFTPLYSRYEGEECKGIQLHVMDRNALDPIAAALRLLELIVKEHGEELVFGSNYGHFDLLMGNETVRTHVIQGDIAAHIEHWRNDIEEYKMRIKQYLLY